MYRVRSPSRLHFGFLNFPADGVDLGGRQFGGVGLMIDRPGIQLSVRPLPQGSSWSAEGPLAARALEFARALVRSIMPANETAFHINIERSGPEHAGLGTGTQLALAVARAMAAALGAPGLDAPTLARHVARGKRSALGIHGFDRGGLVVEGGKGPSTVIAPLLMRLDFPEDWHIMLVMPREAEGLHGIAESAAFAKLAHIQDRRTDEQTKRTDRLCRLVLLGILPAVAEHDLHTFGECVREFNRRVGEIFLPVQGDVYTWRRAKAIVDFIRAQGVPGVGQSSWGPTLFAIAHCDDISGLSQRTREHFALTDSEVTIVRPDNLGAILTTSLGQN